jgi:hypothetical protein
MMTEAMPTINTSTTDINSVSPTHVDDNSTDKVYFINDVEYVTNLRPIDILSGRGSGSNDHSGNVIFRQYVAERKGEYVATNHRRTKIQIASDIAHRVTVIDGGRFLRRLETDEARQLGLFDYNDTSQPKQIQKQRTSSDTSTEILTFYEVIRDEHVIMEKIKQSLRQNAVQVRASIDEEWAAANHERIQKITAKIKKESSDSTNGRPVIDVSTATATSGATVRPVIADIISSNADNVIVINDDDNTSSFSSSNTMSLENRTPPPPPSTSSSSSSSSQKSKLATTAIENSIPLRRKSSSLQPISIQRAALNLLSEYYDAVSTRTLQRAAKNDFEPLPVPSSTVTETTSTPSAFKNSNNDDGFTVPTRYYGGQGGSSLRQSIPNGIQNSIMDPLPMLSCGSLEAMELHNIAGSQNPYYHPHYVQHEPHQQYQHPSNYYFHHYSPSTANPPHFEQYHHNHDHYQQHQQYKNGFVLPPTQPPAQPPTHPPTQPPATTYVRYYHKNCAAVSTKVVPTTATASLTGNSHRRSRRSDIDVNCTDGTCESPSKNNSLTTDISVGTSTPKPTQMQQQAEQSTTSDGNGTNSTGSGSNYSISRSLMNMSLDSVKSFSTSSISLSELSPVESLSLKQHPYEMVWTQSQRQLLYQRQKLEEQRQDDVSIGFSRGGTGNTNSKNNNNNNIGACFDYDNDDNDLRQQKSSSTTTTISGTNNNSSKENTGDIVVDEGREVTGNPSTTMNQQRRRRPIPMQRDGSYRSTIHRNSFRDLQKFHGGSVKGNTHQKKDQSDPISNNGKSNISNINNINNNNMNSLMESFSTLMSISDYNEIDSTTNPIVSSVIHEDDTGLFTSGLTQHLEDDNTGPICYVGSKVLSSSSLRGSSTSKSLRGSATSKASSRTGGSDRRGDNIGDNNSVASMFMSWNDLLHNHGNDSILITGSLIMDIDDCDEDEDDDHNEFHTRESNKKYDDCFDLSLRRVYSDCH